MELFWKLVATVQQLEISGDFFDISVDFNTVQVKSTDEVRCPC